MKKTELEALVDKALHDHPEIFPSGSQIAELLKEYGISISAKAIRRNLELPTIQLRWITSCPEKIFLENFSRKTFNNLDEKCKEAARERFGKIVENKLNEHPEIFPSGSQIAELLMEYGVSITAATICSNLELPAVQLKWITSCPERVFLENFSRNIFNNLDEKCREAAKERFRKIVENKLNEHSEIFPSGSQIAELLKEYRISISAGTICRNLELPAVQLKWITSCPERVFLENISRKTFNNLDEKCKEAVDKRMHDIILSHIDDLGSLSITDNTVKNYFKKFPDLAFLLSAVEEHRFTLDQRIVLAMHIWKEKRSEELHRLIGERLEQLWGFRELIALARSRRCHNGHVISMFHESLPEKVASYIPDASITHFFVDELMNGKFTAEHGKDVLLLSFMHWLTERQTAEILIRLNKAVSNDNTIFMTSPNGLGYSSDLVAQLNAFGFIPERMGDLYLLPPDTGEQQEQRKLLTKSKVLQFRKKEAVELVPEKVELFSEVKKKGNGERVEPTADIISYNSEMLRRAIPSVVMRDVSATFVEEAPEVKEVLLDTKDKAALLTLKGGAVVGFNMELSDPYSIEIEGRVIPKGTDNAILDIINGREGFKVSEEMKESYKKFLNLIKEKRESIGSMKKRVMRKG